MREVRYTIRGKVSYLEHLGENVILHGGIMHPNRSSTDFDTIQDEVVMLPPNLIHMEIYH